MTTYSSALRQLVIGKVDEVRSLTGIADSGIGRAALKNAGFVKQLREGENMTLEKLEQLEIWLDAKLAELAEAAGPDERSRSENLVADG